MANGRARQSVLRYEAWAADSDRACLLSSTTHRTSHPTMASHPVARRRSMRGRSAQASASTCPDEPHCTGLRRSAMKQHPYGSEVGGSSPAERADAERAELRVPEASERADTCWWRGKKRSLVRAPKRPDDRVGDALVSWRTLPADIRERATGRSRGTTDRLILIPAGSGVGRKVLSPGRPIR